MRAGMFGVGSGELVFIAIVLLIAVGPKRMPVLMKSIGRAMREFRRASTELRSQVGLDDLMNDDDLRQPMKMAAKSAMAPAVMASERAPVAVEHVAIEYPPEGVDIAEARFRETKS